MKSKDNVRLIIGCNYKNLKYAEILIKDKIFISSIAALKFDECPKSLNLCLRCLTDEYIEELEKENKK